MTDEVKEKDGSDSTISFSLLDPKTNNYTMLDDDPSTTSTPEKPDKKEKPESKKGSKPLPHSVCFSDNADNTSPIVPMQDADKIISETEDAINNIFQLMLKQRRFLLVCAYQISCLQAIVKDIYNPFLTKMDTFLSHSISFQTEWFIQFSRLLTHYTDYAEVHKDSPAKVVVNEIPNSVVESSLKWLAENVNGNILASRLQTELQRAWNVDIVINLDMQRVSLDPQCLPFQLWMELFEMQNSNAKKIEETCFEILSSVDILTFDGNLMPKK